MADGTTARRRFWVRPRVGTLLTSALAVMVGVGAYTFYYGKGFSYFSTDPRACANCHIMQDQYDSWTKSSHHAVAGCIDCHLPHEIVPKLIAKADNGWRHSWAFTFDNFHEPIQIIPRNSRILQENCITCHGPLVHEIITSQGGESEAQSCIHCHRTVGHGPAK